MQDVVDFYYLYKRGMYTKLLLRVQLAMWKSMNYDARPLILAAAYGIGLPIPEEVLGPNYASYNLADFIHDDHVTILNSEQGLKPDDVILMHHPSYRYDVSQNAHVTPGILQERRAAREKRIEQLLMRMGLDVGLMRGLHVVETLHSHGGEGTGAAARGPWGGEFDEGEVIAAAGGE